LDLEALGEVLDGLRIVALIVVDQTDVVEGGGGVDASLPLDPLLDLEALGEVLDGLHVSPYCILFYSFLVINIR
jgi:hypothetical protein